MTYRFIFLAFLLPIFILLSLGTSLEAKSPCGRKLAIIVDPFSSGDELPDLFIKKGYEVGVVHAHGPETREPLFFSSYVSSGMRSRLVGDWQFSGNAKALARFLRSEGAGIIVSGSESGVIVASQLAKAAGLRGNNPRMSLAWIDKYEMHMALKRAGVPYMEQIKTTDVNKAIEWSLKRGQWPVVIKPPSSAGTNGVRFVLSVDELKEAFAQLYHAKNGMGLVNESVIVQEYVEGPEFAVDTVGINGRHIVTEFLAYERNIVPGAATLYRANHMMPFAGPVQQKLLSYALRVLKALKIENGAAHMEVKIRENGQPVLVEVGARPCGAHTTSLVRACTGYSQTEAVVDAYTDPEGFSQRPIGYDQQKVGLDFFVATQSPGKKFRGESIEELKQIPGVVAIYPNFKDGDVLPRSIDSDSLVLHLQIAHSDPQQLENIRRQLEDLEASGAFERD